MRGLSERGDARHFGHATLSAFNKNNVEMSNVEKKKHSTAFLSLYNTLTLIETLEKFPPLKETNVSISPSTQNATTQAVAPAGT